VLWPEPRPVVLPPVLETALLEGQRVWMRYRDSHGRISERWVDPLDVTSRGRTAYLVAYCHRHGEQRTFRLDRILEMQLEPNLGEPL